MPGFGVWCQQLVLFSSPSLQALVRLRPGALLPRAQPRHQPGLGSQRGAAALGLAGGHGHAGELGGLLFLGEEKLRLVGGLCLVRGASFGGGLELSAHCWATLEALRPLGTDGISSESGLGPEFEVGFLQREV